MKTLLGPGGCPWDQQQTLQTLRSYVLEEAHEVVEAIDSGEPDALREELGDLLLQVVFQAAIAERQAWFDLDQVVSGICDKMERRHPHVFGDETAADADVVRGRWEAIKKAEKGDRGLLEGIPLQLPALMTAYKVGQRAARVGLDFSSAEEARGKLDEELGEVEQALAAGDTAAAEKELGDVLFSLVNWSRKLGLDPEAGLRGSVNRFRDRVAEVEGLAKNRGVALSDLDAAALDGLWDEAKRNG